MQKGRHKKVRYVQEMPKIVQFSPRGRAGRPDEVELKVDQFEALKLADFKGLEQVQGAKIMGISRPSFGRILREARKIVADALVNGKTIRIRIGDVQVGVRRPEALKDLDKSTPRQDLGAGEGLEKLIRNSLLKT